MNAKSNPVVHERQTQNCRKITISSFRRKPESSCNADFTSALDTGMRRYDEVKSVFPAGHVFRGLFLFLILCLPIATQAKTAALAASNPIAEARLVELSAELRCLVCQNESLASSQAPLAEDLRREVRTRIAAGDTNAQIMTYLTDRYGDFVTYRPPFKARTLLLWLLPPILLIAGLILLLRRVQRRRVNPPQVDEAALAALRDEFEGKTNERS
ncbi:MAG: cytochrome c-type biogenesis protein [Deefgea sp.]